MESGGRIEQKNAENSLPAKPKFNNPRYICSFGHIHFTSKEDRAAFLQDTTKKLPGRGQIVFKPSKNKVNLHSYLIILFMIYSVSN